MKPVRVVLASLVAAIALTGAASAFAFQPFGLWPLMPLAFALLCEMVVRAPTLRRALLVGWGFSMIWVGIWVGSAMRSVEAVNGVMFATMFPITFLANTFAPTDRMPTVLRFVAEWNPISSLTQAVRVLWGNDQPLAAGAALPMHHPIPFTIGWIVLITAVVAPLAIRTFRGRTAD